MKKREYVINDNKYRGVSSIVVNNFRNAQMMQSRASFYWGKHNEEVCRILSELVYKLEKYGGYFDVIEDAKNLIDSMK